MPVFSFITINENGKEVKGKVEADDKRSAVSLLRNQSMFVVSVSDLLTAVQGEKKDNLSTKGVLASLRKYLPVTNQDRIFFFQQLAMMIRSGLTLMRALDVCREQTVKLALYKSIGRMKHSIQLGNSFSAAITQERNMFPPLIAKLIYSAEVSGQMEKILEQISIFLTRKGEQKHQLLTSLTYPAIVIFATIGVAAILVLTIIPKFVQFLSRRSLALPWSTQMLVNISNFIQGYLPFIILAILATISGIYLVYRTKRGRLVIDHLLLRVPVVGKLLSIGVMAQMTQTLSVLLRSGITLYESIKTTSSVVRNQSIKLCLEQSSGKILAGNDLSGSFVHDSIPTLIPQVISVGEKSGTLVQVMEEISGFYDKQLQAKTKRLATLVEPALILFIGGMVGFVYFSFFQAVLQLAGR